MKNPFKVRVLDNFCDLPVGKVGLEIIASGEVEKRVFVVLDLSDSCRHVSQALKKLSWVWQRIPQHWQVTLFAMSKFNSLYPEAGSIFSRDLMGFLCDIETQHMWRQWIDDQAKRGSFFQPTLDGIAEVFVSERAGDDASPTEAIAIVVTDGEILDPDTLKIPTWLTCIGILCRQIDRKSNYSSRVVSGVSFFDLGSPDLDSYLTSLICPAMTLCEIIPNFECTMMVSGTICHDKKKPMLWNFRDGPLVLLLDPSAFSNSDCFLDLRLGKNKNYLLSLSGILPFNARYECFYSETKSAANDMFIKIDDPEVVQEILLNLRKSSANRQPISQHTISLILSRFKNESECENAIIVTLPGESGNPMLLLAKLFKDPKRPFFMKGSSDVGKDPGFAPRRNLFVQYNDDAARWFLIHGEERKTLAPRVCGSLQDIFFDSQYVVCEAFYTGPLKLK